MTKAREKVEVEKVNTKPVTDDIKKVDVVDAVEVKVPKNVLEVANLANKGTINEVEEVKEDKIIVNELENPDLTPNQVARMITELEFNNLNQIAYGDLKDELSRYGVGKFFKIGKTKESIINDALRDLEKLRLKITRENSIEENAKLQVAEKNITDRKVIQKSIDTLNLCLKNQVTAIQRRTYIAKREALKDWLNNL